MAAPLLLAVSGLYLLTAVSYYKEGKYGLALCFACYSIANIGIWMEGVSK